MEINFHDQANRMTYAGRSAGGEWTDLMRSLVDAEGLRVADVGCGGGIYTRAWLDLGATSVIGLDFSEAMLSAAQETCRNLAGATFRLADACTTGLEDASVDVVFERALIHHLGDLNAAFVEAARVLAPSGQVVVQDRTVQDVVRPGSPSHIRGYFFERFPFLLELERNRRPAVDVVQNAMATAGFGSVQVHHLRETRRVYRDIQEVRDDLLSRTGRSILHALDDEQLGDLVEFVASRLHGANEIHESDDWTVWKAVKVSPSLAAS